MLAWDVNTIAQTSAAQIADCLLEGTLIAFFAAFLLRLPRRQSSATRFVVWFSALITIVAMPLFGNSWWSSLVGEQAKPAAVTVPVRWAWYAFAAWATVASCFLSGVVRGLWHLHVLRKNSIPVDVAAFDAKVRETIERNRQARSATLYTSDLVRVPTALGFLKPAIIFPRWVMQELSSEELNQILSHEFAHLRRFDDWTNLVQKLVKAFFFFHPAVWWI